MKILSVVFALVVTAVAYAPRAHADWYPFVCPEARSDILTLFRDIRLNEGCNRVSSDKFTLELDSLGYHFESLDAAEAYFTTSPTVEIKLCTWDATGIPDGVSMMRTSFDGTSFDAWKRESEDACNPGERFVYDNGRPVFSLFCGNIIVAPVSKQETEEVIKTQELPAVVMVQQLPAKPRRRCGLTAVPVNDGYASVAVPSGFMMSGSIAVARSRTSTMFVSDCP